MSQTGRGHGNQKVGRQIFCMQSKGLFSDRSSGGVLFYRKTDEESSLVCLTDRVPQNTVERDDGWRGFRIQGILDFSLIGVLSRITTVLADQGIGIFAVSTFNTDYILTKEADFERALEILAFSGYKVM